MSRDIATAIDDTLEDDFIIPVFFVELDFDTDPIYLHTDLGSISTLGETWMGAGGLGQISPIEETTQEKAPGIKLRLDITDESSGSIFEELTQQDFYQRPVIIYFSTRDISSGALSATPIELFRGKADVPEFQDGEESYVDLLVESESIDGERSPNILYSDAQLQSEFSGDLAFEFLADMVNRKVVWGSDRTIVMGQSVAHRRLGGSRGRVAGRRPNLL